MTFFWLVRIFTPEGTDRVTKALESFNVRRVRYDDHLAHCWLYSVTAHPSVRSPQTFRQCPESRACKSRGEALVRRHSETRNRILTVRTSHKKTRCQLCPI